MPQFTTRYTFVFAAGLCALLALAVAAASVGLRPLQEANERRDLQSKILGALGLPEEGEAPLVGAAIDETWTERVEVIVIDEKGDVVRDATLADVAAERAAAKKEARPARLNAVYLRKDGDRIASYAIEMNGMGLWGPISGYLALAPDGVTVSGATFFAPKETPGLGYEITANVFTEQFEGKKIYANGATRPIRVVQGDVSVKCPGDQGQHCVHGISGATLTGRGVDAMIAKALETYDPYLAKVRGGGS